MTYLLYSDSTSATGRELAHALGIRSGTKAPDKREDMLIRWGSTLQIANKPIRVLNNRKAILLATNKLESLVYLRKNGVRTPETWLNGGDVRFPALARKVHHSQGSDIMLCLQKQDVRRALNRRSKYFIQYIPTDREYRTHVFGGEIFRTNQKLLQDKEAWVPHIRNVTNGYVFAQIREPMGDIASQMAIKAVTSLGLDFGAVDLVIGDDGYPYILEVNTGPSLIEVGVEAYADRIKSVL